MPMFKILFAMVLAILAAFPATAEEGRDIPPGVTVVHMSEQELRQVEPDMLRATLRIEESGYSAADIQARINHAMQRAVDAAKKHEDVMVKTGSYHVYQDHRSDQWNGQQTLILESKVAPVVLKLAGDFQKNYGFVTSGLNYFISPQLQAELHDEMTMAALGRIQARAEQIAETLKMKDVHIAEVDLSGGGGSNYSPPRMMRAEMAAMDSAAKPVAERGEETMTVSINAAIWLSR